MEIYSISNKMTWHVSFLFLFLWGSDVFQKGIHIVPNLRDGANTIQSSTLTFRLETKIYWNQPLSIIRCAFSLIWWKIGNENNGGKYVKKYWSHRLDDQTFCCIDSDVIVNAISGAVLFMPNYSKWIEKCADIPNIRFVATKTTSGIQS